MTKSCKAANEAARCGYQFLYWLAENLSSRAPTLLQRCQWPQQGAEAHRRDPKTPRRRRSRPQRGSARSSAGSTDGGGPTNLEGGERQLGYAEGEFQYKACINRISTGLVA